MSTVHRGYDVTVVIRVAATGLEGAKATAKELCASLDGTHMDLISTEVLWAHRTLVHPVRRNGEDDQRDRYENFPSHRPMPHPGSK